MALGTAFPVLALEQRCGHTGGQRERQGFTCAVAIHWLKGGGAGSVPLPVGRGWPAATLFPIVSRSRLVRFGHFRHLTCCTRSPSGAGQGGARAGQEGPWDLMPDQVQFGQVSLLQELAPQPLAAERTREPLWTSSAVSAKTPVCAAPPVPAPGGAPAPPLPSPSPARAEVERACSAPLPVPLPAPFSALPPGPARAALSKLQSKFSGGRWR